MGYGIMHRWDHVPPSKKLVEEENVRMLRRQSNFRLAAEYVAAGFAPMPEVTKVVLFGSVALPLQMEVPSFGRFRRHGTEIFHECMDVDMAVWLTDLSCLKSLGTARGRALNSLLVDHNIGVAHHQVDVFILDPDTNKYLGRLCFYGSCPKGKEDCWVPGCGDTPLLRQHEGFRFSVERSLAPDKTVPLLDRSSGLQPMPPHVQP